MNEFDHRPDSVLGEALRDALTSPDDAAFARRVLDRAPQVLAGESWWEVLAGWARPGVAAAAAVLIGVTVWMADQPPETLIVDEPVAVAETLSAGTLLASQVMPEFQVEMVLGEDRVNE